VALGASIAAAFGWRRSFLVVGAVGVVAALLVIAVVREPRRGGLDHIRTEKVGKAGFLPTVAAFCRNRALMLAAAASGITQIVTYGAGNFSTLFLMREKGMTLREVAVWYALVVAIFMSGGIFVSGRVIDRFVHRAKAAYALIPAATLTAAVPLYLLFVFAPSWPMALVFLAGPTALNYFYLSSCVALVQEEVRPDQRVLSGALFLLIMNLVGLGVGPTFVGAMSDLFHAAHPASSLKLAFLCLTPFYVVAILLFLLLARVLRREEAQALQPHELTR
jgi:predicted MFS family arabinose efflux permease